MNIIFLRSNPVDPDSRVEKEVNALIKNGHTVKILAWDRSAKYTVKKNSLQLENGNIDIYRFGIPAVFGGGMKKNLIPLLRFQLAIYQWLKKNANSFDAIHACDFDTAYTSSIISSKYKKKFVYDIFDYYVDAFNVPLNIRGLIERVDKKIINNADAVIICTEKRTEQIKGTSPKKLVVIHNSPPKQDINNLAPLNLNKDKIKIVYVGILDGGRLIEEIAEIVKNNVDFEYHVAGFGKLEPYLKELSNKYSNIFFYGKIPYKKTLQLEMSCDLMTAIYDPEVRNHYYAAPNKFYEALMLGKPLITINNTGIDTIIKTNNIGEVVNFDLESLEEGLERLQKRRNEWETMSTKMKNIYEKEYNWNYMEVRLVALYRDLNSD